MIKLFNPTKPSNTVQAQFSTNTTKNQCEVKGTPGSVVYAYCPKFLHPEEIANAVLEFSKTHFNNQTNQIHVHIFNDKKITPATSQEFNKMSDANLEKTHVAVYDLNKNTGYNEYQCKKKPSDKKWNNCSNLIK